VSPTAKQMPLGGENVVLELVTGGENGEHGVMVRDWKGREVGFIDWRDLEALEAWIREARG
jgi:hypothetical protein